MKLVMVGTGAFAKKHLDGIARIKGAEAACVFGSGYLVNAGIAPVLAGRGFQKLTIDRPR